MPMDVLFYRIFRHESARVVDRDGLSRSQEWLWNMYGIGVPVIAEIEGAMSLGYLCRLIQQTVPR